MSAGDEDWNSISKPEYTTFLVMALALSVPVIYGATPWLLAFTGAIVILATIGRAATVNRQRRRETD